MLVSKKYGDFEVSFEVKDIFDLFDQFSQVDKSFQEILGEVIPGAALKSGKDSTNFRLNKRVVEKDKKKYTYFELVANEFPYPRLSLGQYQDGSGLFPKRKDSQGNEIGVRGWQTFKKEDD